MSTLTRALLIDLIETRYFGNVDAKQLDATLACFQPDAAVGVQTANVIYQGEAAIRRMFADFIGSTRTVYHGDDSHVADVEGQRIASQIAASLPSSSEPFAPQPAVTSCLPRCGAAPGVAAPPSCATSGMPRSRAARSCIWRRCPPAICETKISSIARSGTFPSRAFPSPRWW